MRAVGGGGASHCVLLLDALAAAVGAGAVQHELGTRHREAGGQRRGGGGHVLQADDLAAALAVEVGVAVITIAADLEAPRALAAGDALRDALLNQPVERTVEGDAVVGDARAVERCADLVVRQRMRAALQGLDHRHSRARDPATARGDEFAGGVGGDAGAVTECSCGGHGQACCGGQWWQGRLLLMQHCSIRFAPPALHGFQCPSRFPILSSPLPRPRLMPRRLRSPLAALSGLLALVAPAAALAQHAHGAHEHGVAELTGGARGPHAAGRADLAARQPRRLRARAGRRGAARGARRRRKPALRTPLRCSRFLPRRVAPSARWRSNRPGRRASASMITAHAHDHAQPTRGDHEDMVVSYGFECAHPEALRRLELRAFDALPAPAPGPRRVRHPARPGGRGAHAGRGRARAVSVAESAAATAAVRISALRYRWPGSAQDCLAIDALQPRQRASAPSCAAPAAAARPRCCRSSAG